MHDTQSQTESLLDIVKGIDNRTIMLPEFQRDFRWELEQTYDLFDSLIREIFIGTLIYGKPSFEMTLREIDKRPRKGKGSNSALSTHDYTGDEIKRLAQTRNLRIVLDGQQRITSIYRALTGIDNVYLILRDDLDAGTINQYGLEDMIADVAGEESPATISVKLSVAYETEIKALEADDLNECFGQTKYAQRRLNKADETQRKAAEKIYRWAVRKLLDLYKQQKLVAFYLLDMSLDKFCIFFERSNSRNIQLNFTDILAAKLYRRFNLRKKIEEFESQGKFKLNREIIVRGIAYICGVEGGGAISIDKKYILEHLDVVDFETHWDSTCALYVESLNYLISQYYILSQDWMPSENMILPLMMFRRSMRSFDQITEDQRAFLEYWYWASIFANRYSGSSNEVIITDCAALTQVARGERIAIRGYFSRLRSLIAEPQDLFSYTKKSSAIYRGVLNLLSYHAQGLRDWNSMHKINMEMRLEDHHIYPRAYIASRPALDIDQDEAEQMIDSVVNRTLIPKLLNIQIGKKAPQVYLAELQERTNAQIATCLIDHQIPTNIITEPTWNNYFRLFLDERANAIFALIDQYVIAPAAEMATRYGTQVEILDSSPLNSRSRLKDMFSDGRVRAGDRMYVRRHPDRYAILVDGDTVEFEGKRLSINAWGEQMTGWSSINVYEQVYLERTGQPLKSLRGDVSGGPAVAAHQGSSQ